MPLLYGSLSRPEDGGGQVLAEYCAVKGNFSAAGEVCMQRLDPSKAGPITFAMQEYNGSYEARDGLMYGVIGTNDVQRSLCHSVLSQLSAELTKSGQEPRMLRDAPPRMLQKAFGPKIKQVLDHANAHPADFDKIQKVQESVNEVKEIVVQNIDKVLERGEKMEVLEDKTATLQASAGQFQKQGKELRNRLWWQEKKAKIVFAVMTAVVIMVVIILVLNFLVTSANDDDHAVVKQLL